MAAFAVQVATRLSVIYLFGGSFNKVHCRYNRIVQPVSCFRVPPHDFSPDTAFGREQSNSTGETHTRVAFSFTSAHPNSEIWKRSFYGKGYWHRD